MLAMYPRHVFNSRRGHSDIDMPSLFASLQLSSRELGVHLRGGLVGECRELHGVRYREVQERGGTWLLRRLPGSLRFAYCEH